jgi:hypothetical protein
MGTSVWVCQDDKVVVAEDCGAQGLVCLKDSGAAACGEEPPTEPVDGSTGIGDAGGGAADVAIDGGAVDGDTESDLVEVDTAATEADVLTMWRRTWRDPAVWTATPRAWATTAP